MRPVLPKNNDQQAGSKYRTDLHEDLYPQTPVYTPSVGLLTTSGASGSIVRMGRINVVSVILAAPVVISSGGYFDLPFNVSQASVFNVAAGTTAYSGVVSAGQSRVYLPNISPVGAVTISGVVVT